MWKWIGFRGGGKDTVPSSRKENSNETFNVRGTSFRPKTHVQHPSPPRLTDVNGIYNNKCYSPALCLYNQFELLLANQAPENRQPNEQESQNQGNASECRPPCAESCERKEREEKSKGLSSEKPCKRKRHNSYFPRFVLTVLEALRDLVEELPVCGGYSLDTITSHVGENFIVDGDVAAQVRTALRLAHVAGLVIYIEDYKAYQLASSAISDMEVSEKRYKRFLRKRREVAEIDTSLLVTSSGKKCSETSQDVPKDNQDV